MTKKENGKWTTGRILRYVCGPGLLLVVLFRANNHIEVNLDKVRDECTSSKVADDFGLATNESLGFFTDINSRDWLLRKNISKNMPHHTTKKLNPRRIHRPQTFYQNHWDPDFSCAYEVAIGSLGDGQKWTCDPHRLQKDCLVYSVGSQGNFAFEKHFNAVAPQCEIHIFDPADYSGDMKRENVQAFYHQWGIKGSRDEKIQNEGDRIFITFQESIEKLGHQGRRIDVFKSDCDGCEWEAYKDWIQFDLRQILIEVHNHPPAENTMFQDLHDAGYVIFHKEPNIQHSDGKCIEYAFLKLHPDFFK